MEVWEEDLPALLPYFGLLFCLGTCRAFRTGPFILGTRAPGDTGTMGVAFIGVSSRAGAPANERRRRAERSVTAFPILMCVCLNEWLSRSHFSLRCCGGGKDRVLRPWATVCLCVVSGPGWVSSPRLGTEEVFVCLFVCSGRDLLGPNCCPKRNAYCRAHWQITTSYAEEIFFASFHCCVHV